MTYSLMDVWHRIYVLPGLPMLMAQNLSLKLRIIHAHVPYTTNLLQNLITECDLSCRTN